MGPASCPAPAPARTFGSRGRAGKAGLSMLGGSGRETRNARGRRSSWGWRARSTVGPVPAVPGLGRDGTAQRRAAGRAGSRAAACRRARTGARLRAGRVQPHAVADQRPVLDRGDPPGRGDDPDLPQCQRLRGGRQGRPRRPRRAGLPRGAGSPGRRRGERRLHRRDAGRQAGRGGGTPGGVRRSRALDLVAGYAATRGRSAVLRRGHHQHHRAARARRAA